MSGRWYKEAVVYCIQVDMFADSDGDGCGDLPGLIGRLDYLSRLGVSCLWLNPVHPSPQRDQGYDVSDYYNVDPRIGDLGDFAELTFQASERGIRIIIDLVVNHTSDQHPWFRSARSSRTSPYRDWYIWSEQEPADRRQGIVFPGEQTETWSWDEEAGEWFFHRFYDFQPDLNWSNPAVRAEIRKVMSFWLQMGVSGFRIDAAPFVLELVNAGQPTTLDFSILDDWRQNVQWRSGEAILLCEANVGPGEIDKYTGSTAEGPNDRAHMLFSFLLNARLWLALARKSAEPIIESLSALPPLQDMAQWASFLRNHDELDLSRLTDEQRSDVFKAFAPKPDMQLYGRGIRRRLAPMLGGNRRRIELAYSLQFSMPGTPVLRYGEEIGMGDDLSLPGRDAIRTPMQWDDGPSGGFSTAVDPLVAPVTMTGAYGARRVNVRALQRDPDSLLRWFEQLISTVRECPEIGVGTWSVLDVPSVPAVLVHRFDAPEGSMVLLHNLGDAPVVVDIGPQEGTDRPWEMFADGPYRRPTAQLRRLELNGLGYRWIRLRHGRSM
ncbi:maltose alpha-D-glucosyltransferase/ alpha-amylase [Nakamurella panacisegetis]|uniref:Alpha-amylase n=1 Tax=Nakamurella panacisegetis TaxID=1090615 RepID=A0A1H0QTL3_9ACTN|nr:alpha-amylase family protein [Nakamurella panacisegetis]SDP20099.1 maltose alpha-D-glucosyltransferase/ alpha-amylase [Nakamurella panacisegetis]